MTVLNCELHGRPITRATHRRTFVCHFACAVGLSALTQYTWKPSFSKSL